MNWVTIYSKNPEEGCASKNPKKGKRSPVRSGNASLPKSSLQFRKCFSPNILFLKRQQNAVPAPMTSNHKGLKNLSSRKIRATRSTLRTLRALKLPCGTTGGHRFKPGWKAWWSAHNLEMMLIFQIPTQILKQNEKLIYWFLTSTTAGAVFSRFTIHIVDLSDLTSLTIFQVTMSLCGRKFWNIQQNKARPHPDSNSRKSLRQAETIWTFHGFFSEVFSPKTRHCLNYPRRAPIQRCPQQKAPPTGSPWDKADRLPLMCGHLYIEINEHGWKPHAWSYTWTII